VYQISTPVTSLITGFLPLTPRMPRNSLRFVTEQRTRPLGYAIIGCGRIFSSHLAGVLQNPLARMAAVCDIDEQKRAAAVSASGAPFSAADYRRVLEREDVDIVDICLPHHLHCEVSLAALDAGKHVLCEKPIATTLPDALRMIERAETRGLALGIVYQNRYNTASTRLRRAFEEGRFGRIVTASCVMNNFKPQGYYEDAWHGRWQTEGGGTLTTQAIHNMDLIHWFLGTPVSVTAHAATLEHTAEVEDTAAATIAFQGGALASFISTNCSHQPWTQRLEICGTRGNVVIEENRIVRWDFSEKRPGEESHGKEDAELPIPGASGYGPSHPRLIADFLSCVREGKPFAVHGREGLKVSLLIWAIYRSARSGRRETV
jgi:UDP-N-acetyl-2-amino-2-deoxyglucuronate dehydrogenase